MESRLISGCNLIIRWGFYLLFILVPLILTPWNYELFEYNKMMVTYALTVIIAAAWFSKMFLRRQISIAQTPLDIPLALFFVSQFVSALFSLDPHVSWLGYYSRFNGGLWSVISYVFLYYALVSNWSEVLRDKYLVLRNKTKKSEPQTPSSVILNTLYPLLRVALATASAIAFYGVLERLGIDKNLWVQDVQNRVFSSLGQPNWLAAYLVALVPIAAGFALKAQMSKLKIQNNVKAQNPKQFGNLNFGFHLSFGFWIWSFITALFFLVLLFTRSRSGLLGFAVADIVFWGLIALFSKKVKPFEAKSFSLPFVIYHVSFIIIVFLNGTGFPQFDRYFTLQAWKQGLARSTIQQSNEAAMPSQPTNYTPPLLESGGTESGVIRKYVWQGALNAWKSSTKTFWIGTGTETFAFAFYRHKPAAHNLTSEWDFLYNKAHNEYLNYLATTGIFGLGSYLLIIFSFVWWFVKTHREKLMLFALFSGWTSILITNFFGFSVVIVQLFFFLFPAIIIAASATLETRGVSLRLAVVPRVSKILVLTALLSGIYLLLVLAKFWYADKAFAAGYRLARANQYSDAQILLARAISLNGREPLYHDEMGTILASLTLFTIENNDATAAAALAQQALTESDTALTISPQNVNFWKSRTKIFHAFSSFDPEFTPAAIAALQQALALSPTDPKIVYNLAILSGRQNDNLQAIEMLKKTIDLKPNYRDAYWGLYVFYTEAKQLQLARATLEEYLNKVDPNDQQFKQLLEK